MKKLRLAPELPGDWPRPMRNVALLILADDIVAAIPDEDRGLTGISEEEPLQAEWIGAVNEISQALSEVVVGCEKDPRTQEVIVDEVGGFDLDYGVWRGARVAVLLYWRTRWSGDIQLSVIDPYRDITIYVHPEDESAFIATLNYAQKEH